MKKVLEIALIVMFAMCAYSRQPPPGQPPNPTINGESEQGKSPRADQNPEQKENSPRQAMLAGNERVPGQTQKEAKDGRSVSDKKGIKGWPISDKIAAIATFLALANVVALIWTIVAQRRSIKRQLRAYVFVDSVNVFNVWGHPPPPTPQQPIPTGGGHIYRPQEGPIISIIIKNTGQTPSYETKHLAMVYLREYPLLHDLPDIQKDLPSETTPIPVGGQTTLSRVMSQPLTPDGFQGLNSNKIAIYVVGKIVYKDAFNQEWETNYRYFYNRVTGVIGMNTGMSIHEKGNSAT